MRTFAHEIERLKDGPSRDDIWEATLALRGFGEEGRVLLISIVLSQDEPSILRARVVDVLHGMRHPAIVDALITALGDSDLVLRWHAVGALADMADPRAIPSLEQLAKRDSDAPIYIASTLRVFLHKAAEKAIDQIREDNRVSPT